MSEMGRGLSEVECSHLFPCTPDYRCSMHRKPGRVLTAWRDPKRGKHHLFGPQDRVALCGQVIHMGWENQRERTWAPEDCCKRCQAKTTPAREQS